MNYLHNELELNESDVVEVSLNHAANVQLLDEANFALYQQGKPYRYIGGYYQETPARIPTPRDGRWHLVVDLGGGAGSVRASLRVISPMAVA